MLFKTGVDRTQTQLAYKLKYFPFASVPPAGRKLVSMRRIMTVTKAQLIEHMDETKCDLFMSKRNWNIVWAYNNIPTEQEWNKIPLHAKFLVELRASPAIDCFAVAIIYSFEKSNVVGIFQGAASKLEHFEA